MKKILSLILCALLLFTAVGCSNGKTDGSDDTPPGSETPGGDNPTPGGDNPTPGDEETPGDLSGTLEQTDMQTGFQRTAATDDFGRSFTQTESYNDKVVGIFYFLWLSQASNDNTVEKYIAEGRAEETLTSQDEFGTPKFTWWGEPMYGYYLVQDKWVVRKHVELFINAGLDFICFDTTNNNHYASDARAVLDVLLEYEKMGYRVPKAMFMTNSDSPGRIKAIYNDFYRRNTYDSIWFTGNGDKPWIIGSAPATDQNIMDRFYFKRVQWPNVALYEDRFPWISWQWPQESYYDAENNYDIMSVSVTQHVGDGNGAEFSLSGVCSPLIFGTLSEDARTRIMNARGGNDPDAAAKYFYNKNWGRGFSHETGENNYEDALANVNFEEQWQTVYENESINLVFVTGWNEWIAQRQSTDPVLGNTYGRYIDTFDMEFSRDIEMMNGGYLDNCFLQLVKNIRTFKGDGSTKIETAATDKDLYHLENWADMPAYADLVKETEARNSIGVGDHFYKNETGRNDIREVRVATTDQDIYFLVSTVDDLTARTAGDTRYMNVWLGIDGQAGGWNGLQYVINRAADGSVASVDKIENGTFTRVGDAEVTVSGRFMLVKVAKSVVGVSGNGFGLQFKVTDNLQSDFDITDLYTNGDCAPIGRIKYSYYAN